MRTAVILFTLLLVSPATAQDVRVVDGDTIEIGAITYRLFGIDAPEAGQRCNDPSGRTWRCGERATEALKALIAGNAVSCIARGEDDYGRTLAVCSAGGVELNSAMVEGSLAWSFRRYARNYDAKEERAQRDRLGIWQAETETPWDYRARRWNIAKASGEPPAGCPIKGNINREGERIYHPPWSPWYDRTKINEAQGERWFCDEGEAIAAGWRAPRWGR